MPRAARCALLLAIALVGAPRQAAARSSDPGTLFLSPILGPSFKLNTLLGGSPAYFTLGGGGEYVLDPHTSVTGDVNLGLASTLPLRFHGGMRFHLVDLGAVAPFLQAQVSLGGLFNVIGANLFWLGGRVAAGTDFFFTSDLGAGAMVAVDMGSTTGVRPAFYGIIEVLLYASFKVM